MRNYISIFSKKYAKQIDFPHCNAWRILNTAFHSPLPSISRSCADVR